jgi:hypothetical protein
MWVSNYYVPGWLSACQMFKQESCGALRQGGLRGDRASLTGVLNACLIVQGRSADGISAVSPCCVHAAAAARHERDDELCAGVEWLVVCRMSLVNGSICCTTGMLAARSWQLFFIAAAMSVCQFS